MKVNKYSIFEYEDLEMPSDDMDTDIKCWHSTLVKVRKSRKCSYCGSSIESGDCALSESGFLDNKPFRIYNCIDCVDDLLDMYRSVIDSEEYYRRWESRSKLNGYLR